MLIGLLLCKFSHCNESIIFETVPGYRSLKTYIARTVTRGLKQVRQGYGVGRLRPHVNGGKVLPVENCDLRAQNNRFFVIDFYIIGTLYNFIYQ